MLEGKTLYLQLEVVHHGTMGARQIAMNGLNNRRGEGQFNAVHHTKSITASCLAMYGVDGE